MTRAEQAAALLQRVKQLAEEHGPALKRAHTLLVNGALVGPAADRLHQTLVREHNDVRSAFYTAFDAVQRLAAEAGPPRVREPYIPGPPRALPSSPAIRSGSPEELDRLSAELTYAANTWDDSAQALSEILANLALGTAPATTIARAASQLAHQRAQVRRSRDELLKTAEQNAARPSDTGGFFDDGWNAYAHHYLPGLGEGLKDLGLSALAGNPVTAPVYIAANPGSWLQRGPVGQARGLIEGVRHPVAFAKAVVNWEEWKRDPARAFGEAVPTIVITAATLGTGAGSGAAARMAGGVRRIGTKKPVEPVGPRPALTAAEKQTLEKHLNDLKAQHPEKYAEAAKDPDHNFKATKGSRDEARISLDLMKKGIFDENYTRPSGPQQGDFIDKGIHWDIKGIHSDWPPHVPAHVRSRPFPNAYNEADFRRTVRKQLEMGRGVILDTRNADQSAITEMKRIVDEEGWGDRIIWYP
ncbi:hypothetical protein [Spirillospora sp. NPDC048819]|uniref:hypothetical protein n=1 Tax=Spirillospora sp. NPDC048819 TaxID=3155268 RepID=UPI0034059833